MPGANELLLFSLASFVLIAVPGPAVIYIVARGVGGGRRAGLVSMLGIETGALVHVAAAALGLSALLASSATAFTIVKYAGAAYLVYLGVRKLLEGEDEQVEALAPVPHRRVYGQGVLVSVLNPKIALFFLAFLPQFIEPANGAVALQALLLGVLFVTIAFFCDGAYALVAGSLGDRLRRSARARRRLQHSSGGVYIGLGAVAALTGERPK
jgi:threonine/homoserine/homoserine lactone efflux protein